MDKKTYIKQLRNKQNSLCDEILTKPEELEKIIDLQLKARQGFHNYSLMNLVTANWQLIEQHGEGIELLSSYKNWQKMGRQVKRGEKALYVLAPIQKKIGEDEEGNPEYITWFKGVPVFDLSQTDGENLETDFTTGTYDFTLEEITSRTNVPVVMSHKQLTRGSTDGYKIWISSKISVNHQICTYFHEFAHYLLHFDSNRKELTTATKELEAEAVAYLVSSFIGIENGESSAYIYNWTKNVSDTDKKELLKGKGSKVLRTAQKIINDLKLGELLDSKMNTITNNSSSDDVGVTV